MSLENPEPVEAELVETTADSTESNRRDVDAVADTIVGLNLRVSDNVFQAVAIAGCILLGATTGALLVEEPPAGAVFGGFAGLVFGFFASGIVLMFARARPHMRRKRD
ncbi:MAG: hypothetical protein KDA42_08565 [Planctomycetales bacterium]|nr:hypothetical protein [Planctomycetales bacterium]